jgi:predicted GNAT family acetyltransferase
MTRVSGYRWSTAGPDDLPALLQFLTEREHFCVSFTSRLSRQGRPALPPLGDARIHLLRSDSADTAPAAAVLQMSSGYLFPVLGRISPENRKEREHVLQELNRRVYREYCGVTMVMGMRPDVESCMAVLPGTPVHLVRYYMMYLDTRSGQHTPATQQPFPDGVRFRDAGATDLRALFPMQIKYELEEVLLPGRHLSEELTRRYLKRDLKEQIVVMAEDNGVPIAKAGTNAQGFRWYQVGGVYTERAYRNRGIGGALMLYLLERIEDRSKGTCLFVKQENPAACAMYRRLGFMHAGEFIIAYYK